MKILVLTPGATTPNGAGFIFPLWLFRHQCIDLDLHVTFFKRDSPSLQDCDVLIVDSKFHRSNWISAPQETLDQETLEKFDGWSQATKVIYCDTSDSTGSLQNELLPIVRKYAKSQILNPKHKYKNSYYGNRVFCDYYHNKFGVKDTSPQWSRPIINKRHLDKICVSWNSGLSDHSFSGLYRNALIAKTGAYKLSRLPHPICRPDNNRKTEVSCRFGATHLRDTVSAQRHLIATAFKKYKLIKKLGRWSYFQELKSAKIVISPFGWGEITLKDFEVFLTGGMLIKPDMAHLKTWPNFYIPGETCYAHKWDLSDLEAVVESLLLENELRLKIAHNGQQNFEKYTTGSTAGELFASHLCDLVTI